MDKDSLPLVSTVLILRGLIAKFLLKRLESYVSKTSNQFDDALVKASEGPVKFLPIVLGFFVATSYMDFEGKTLTFIDNLNRSLVTILIFWLKFSKSEQKSAVFSNITMNSDEEEKGENENLGEQCYDTVLE